MGKSSHFEGFLRGLKGQKQFAINPANLASRVLQGLFYTSPPSKNYLSNTITLAEQEFLFYFLAK
jgi:hypothetical protein